MIKIASYCRVSTDSDDQANSFVTQQQYFQEYIEHQPNWELYKIYADEGITGTSTKKRIQFNQMIHDAYKGRFQLIITKEVSRFSRNILDTISYTRELRSIGVGVLFLTDRINTTEPESEMLLSFLASLAQEESRRTSGRVVWGQTRQMEKGVVFGQSLLGYDVKNGHISVNAAGAHIVRLIFQKYALEQVCTSEIARFLSREGYCTYRGSNQWNSKNVLRILKNEKYVGDLVQKKTYTPDYLTHEKKRNTGQVPLITIKDHHEAIISREVWNLAQDRLRQNNKHGEGQGGHSNRYVFSGKIRCGECGASFVGRFKYLQDGSKIRRWNCRTTASAGAAACSVGKLLRDDDAIQMLKTAIRSLRFDRKRITRSVCDLALNAICAEKSFSSNEARRLSFELEQVTKKKETVLDSYFSQEISKQDMQNMKRKYDEQIEALRNQLEKVKNLPQESNDEALRRTINLIISSILHGKTESEVLFKTLLEGMTVFKDRHIELRLNHLPQVFQFGE